MSEQIVGSTFSTIDFDQHITVVAEQKKKHKTNKLQRIKNHLQKCRYLTDSGRLDLCSDSLGKEKPGKIIYIEIIEMAGQVLCCKTNPK